MRDINFLQEDITIQDLNESLIKVKSRTSVKSGILRCVVILFMIISLLAPIFYMKELEQNKSSIESQLSSEKYVQAKSLNTQLANINEILEFKKEVINNIDIQNYPVSEMLSMLKNIAPSGATINSLTYDSKKLAVSVSTKDLTQIAEFISNAKKSEYLTPSDSMKEININKDSALQLTFDVGRKSPK